MKTLQALSTYSFDHHLLSLFRQLGEFKGNQALSLRQPPEVLDTLRQMAIVESVTHSFALEGIPLKPERVKKLVNSDGQPEKTIEGQAVGYRDCVELVTEPGEHMTLSIGLVSQLHTMIYDRIAHEGGRWRVTNKEMVERDAKGNKIGILYRTVPPSSILDAMEELTANYQQGLQEQVEPLLLIPAFILDFLCVHPFSDGNSRVGWLMMTLMLIKNGYQLPRLFSLERLFAKQEPAYRRALRLSVKGWHKGQHNPMPWIEFFLNTLINGYEEMEAKIQTFQHQGIRAPKSQLVRIAVDRSLKTFSIADISMQIPTVSRELVKKVLQQMRSEGAVESVGKGRGSQWRKV